MIAPEFRQAHQDEAKGRDSWMNEAWEGVDYTDLETEEDWLEKSTAIEAGKDYDTRVSIPVDFSDEELLKYMKLAHDRDMTFNQFVEEALRQAIEEHKRDPEGMMTKVDQWKSSRDIT
jgi:hypothetical protein